MSISRVIAGDYQGQLVTVSWKGEAVINNSIPLNKTTVSSYDLVNETQRKSTTSAVTRPAIGGFLLGPVGLFAGLSAKSKGKYTISINFFDGRKSLIEVDDNVKNALIKALY